MRGDVFYHWFCGVLPLLNENSKIFMDNVSYHWIKKDSIPTIAWKKDEIIYWLQDKNVVHDMSLVKMH